MFIHAFGAYFGLAVSMMHRNRKVKLSEGLEGSRYTTDIFSLVCIVKNITKYKQIILTTGRKRRVNLRILICTCICIALAFALHLHLRVDLHNARRRINCITNVNEAINYNMLRY